MKKVITVMLVIIMVSLLLIPCCATDESTQTIEYWKARQAKCHETADMLRALGFDDSQFSYLGEEWYHCKEEIAALSTPAATTVEINVYDYFTESDIQALAGVMSAEYNGIVVKLGEEKGGREVRRIGWAVLNRVDSSIFPNTLQGVIYQSNQMAHSSNMQYYSYAKEVLQLYLDWKLNGADVREMGTQYLYWGGNGSTNTFRSYCYVNGGGNHGWNLNVDREWQS